MKYLRILSEINIVSTGIMERQNPSIFPSRFLHRARCHRRPQRHGERHGELHRRRLHAGLRLLHLQGGRLPVRPDERLPGKEDGSFTSPGLDFFQLWKFNPRWLSVEVWFLFLKTFSCIVCKLSLYHQWTRANHFSFFVSFKTLKET